MVDRLKLLSRKRRYLLGLIILLSVSMTCVALYIGGNDDFDMARREVLLRKVGDELLSQSGDHTSRVLPVKKITENEYQLMFEKDLTFLPDSLVSTTRRVLARDPLASDYVVNVLNNGTSGVTYGFAMSKNKKNDIIACRGRKQPKAAYTIDIKFKPAGINTAKTGYLLGSMAFLAFAGLIFLTPVKQRSASPKGQVTGTFTFGTMLFDAHNRQLVINKTTIDLTGTETRLLRIFALSPNEIIERSRLQKEIWEDEGVIVGRSLDMFISKLRKKAGN